VTGAMNRYRRRATVLMNCGAPGFVAERLTQLGHGLRERVVGDVRIGHSDASSASFVTSAAE